MLFSQFITVDIHALTWLLLSLKLEDTLEFWHINCHILVNLTSIMTLWENICFSDKDISL